MSEKIKVCANCGAKNPADEVQCSVCQCMLPNVKTEAFTQEVSFGAEACQEQPAEPIPQLLPPDDVDKPEPAPQTAPETEKVVIGRLDLDRNAAPIRVTVTDLDINFWSLTMILVKFAFAIIPAALIVTLLIVFIGAVVKGLFA